MAVLDNGMQINTIMPNYVKSHSLEMGPITDLIMARVACMGLGNAYTQPLGYIIVWVQVNGVQGYDEVQIALVVPDLLNFVKRISIILGTPTISHVINVMKEREMDALTTPWANARVPISCQYIELRPQWWATKPCKIPVWMVMMRWSSLKIWRL